MKINSVFVKHEPEQKDKVTTVILNPKFIKFLYHQKGSLTLYTDHTIGDSNLQTVIVFRSGMVIVIDFQLYDDSSQRLTIECQEDQILVNDTASSSIADAYNNIIEALIAVRPCEIEVPK